MMLCPSVAPDSLAEAREFLSRHHSRFEIVELRVDRLRVPDFGALLGGRRPRVIVTNRSRAEGGAYRGTPGEQATVLAEAAAAGAEFVDCEFRLGRNLLERLFAAIPGKQIILSHHDITRTPSSLLPLYRRMREYPAGILKLVTTARDIHDNLVCEELLATARRDRRKTIALCMGERGTMSRVLGNRFGSSMMFAASDKSAPTAPGQIRIGDLRTLYRAEKLTAKSAIFGLIGNPVSRSRGIYYHNAIFSRIRADAVYLNFLVDSTGRFLHDFGHILRGASVTMPFKEGILAFVDSVDPDAREIASANTLIRTSAGFRASNTDLPALEHLLGRAAPLRGKQVLVVGSGAMARTAVFAALRGGAFPVVSARSAKKASLVAGRFGCAMIPFEERGILHADVIINTTAIGMPGHESETVVPPSSLKRGVVAVECVQSPDGTQFTRLARRSGCRVITGEALFEAQAALQSKMFLRAM